MTIIHVVFVINFFCKLKTQNTMETSNINVEIPDEVARLARAHAQLLNLRMPDYIIKLIEEATKNIKKELIQ